MTLGTQEGFQNPCVTGPYPLGEGQPLLTTTRLGLPAPHSPGAHSWTTSATVPRGYWGLRFLLHQGFSGLNAQLSTGILTESWEGFWNSAISGEQSLSFHQVPKGIYNLKVPGDSKYHTTTQGKATKSSGGFYW